MMAAINLLALCKQSTPSHHPDEGMDQSLRGHAGFFDRQTSHGIVLVFSPKTIGVHRYKPELAMMFPSCHPLC